MIATRQLFPHRITIIAGHYGVGKTEVAVNLALYLAREKEEDEEALTIADLDIVNPYFRARERREELEDAGIRVICSSQACADADVPSLPPDLSSVFDDRKVRAVFDVGGDPAGARVLARFTPRIRKEDAALYFVLNANRPEVATPEKAIACLRAIEEVTSLSCSGLINNTHLCDETTMEDIQKGEELARVVALETGLPLICHVTEKKHLPEAERMLTTGPCFPIDIRMLKPWEICSRVDGE